MRTILRMTAACLFLFAVCCVGNAGEGEQAEFLNGVYSITVPDNWIATENDDKSGVILSPRTGAMGRMLFVGAPNILVNKDDFVDFAGMQLGLFFAHLGGEAEILHEEEIAIEGMPAAVFVFGVTLTGDVLMSGAGTVVYVDDAASVLYLAVEVGEISSELADTLDKVLESYQLNEDAITPNAALMRQVSQAMMDEVADVMAQ